MKMSRAVLLVAAAAFAMQPVTAVTARTGLNPIRKVVTMLQAMETKVTTEAKEQKKLHEKYMCYCETGGSQLKTAIEGGEQKGPETTAEISETQGAQATMKEELKAHISDRTDAKAAMEEATAIREKEAAAFAAEKGDYDANVAAIAKAVGALEKGVTGLFLQTSAADVLRQLAQDSKHDIEEDDRQDLLAFLSSQPIGHAYAPQSGQIIGILKQISDTMTASTADIVKAEEEAIKVYEELVDAKQKETEALTSAIEEKTERNGEMAVEIVNLQEDLEETMAALDENKNMLADLEKGCATQEQEYAAQVSTRAEELKALAEVIKMLNDDDALDLFKSTLSLLQVERSADSMRAKALALIKASRHPAGQRAWMELLSLALTGKKTDFSKVITMIDEMIAMLKEEQTDDDNKKEYCIVTLDSADDKKKELEQSIADEEKTIATAEEANKTLTEEIAALEAGIIALDKSVAEATEQRQAENKEYTEMMASHTAAKDLLTLAKNRLNEFYNKAIHKPTEPPALSREDQIFVNFGGTPPPTEAPGGIAGTGIKVALVQVAARAMRQKQPVDLPPPPDATGYTKKMDESTGVIAMMDLLMKDLDKELTEGTEMEKDSQEEYEQMMKDSAAKRVADTEAIQQKEETKAGVEADLAKSKEAHAAFTKELMATMEYIAALHSECDWLMKYYETRKEARSGEMDSLKNAKAVLSGADYSLLQTQTARTNRGFLARVQRH